MSGIYVAGYPADCNADPAIGKVSRVDQQTRGDLQTSWEHSARDEVTAEWYLVNNGREGALQSRVGKLHSMLATQRWSTALGKLTHFKKFYPPALFLALFDSLVGRRVPSPI